MEQLTTIADCFSLPLLCGVVLCCVRQYLWCDGVKIKKPMTVSAPAYVDYLMTWVESQLNDEEIFPIKFDAPFPKKVTISSHTAVDGRDHGCVTLRGILPPWLAIDAMLAMSAHIGCVLHLPNISVSGHLRHHLQAILQNIRQQHNTRGTPNEHNHDRGREGLTAG